MIDYSRLNPEQYEAVFSDHRRILCLAGAGTGKTQVLTSRIARLWEDGVNPNNMLALTFTRAAGAEMKERVIKLIGEHGKHLFCNTFHAFCVEVIQDNAPLLGYTPNFSVYDQRECDDIQNEVLGDLRLKIPAQAFADYRAGKSSEMTVAICKQAERAVKEYEYRLKRNNAFDFDGLINTLKRAIKDYPEIHSKLTNRYEYIFVDEFQDTDSEQWGIVQSVAHDNLFVVGDDFQSIYGFRGSEIDIILGLASNPDWHTIKLQQNYRSTLPIITAANALIKHNDQTEKQLITDKDGVTVSFRRPQDEKNEILDIVEILKNNQKPDVNKTTAILARTNRQIDNAKFVLKEAGVPYEANTVADNPLASHDAKTTLAWLAAIENPSDNVCMQKIMASKMGKAALLEIEKLHLDSSETLFDALQETDSGSEFLQIFYEVEDLLAPLSDIATSVEQIQKNLGIKNETVLQEVERWKQRQVDLGESATTSDLLQFARLSNIAEKSTKKQDASKVHLMTVHGSKGLEFDEVYIIGAAQGIFPNQGNLQEERRLFYVAITRAKEYLDISCPLTMSDWGAKERQAMTSQFVKEALWM